MDKSCKNKHFGKELRQVVNLISRFVESKANEEGVTFVQGRFLHYISSKKQGSICQKDIEKEFDIRRSSATEMLQKLEKNGLIERIEDDKDKRSKRIHITDKGREIEKTIFGFICEFEKQIKKGISSEEINVFFEVISKIKLNLENVFKEEI